MEHYKWPQTIKLNEGQATTAHVGARLQNFYARWSPNGWDKAILVVILIYKLTLFKADTNYGRDYLETRLLKRSSLSVKERFAVDKFQKLSLLLHILGGHLSGLIQFTDVAA